MARFAYSTLIVSIMLALLLSGAPSRHAPSDSVAATLPALAPDLAEITR